MSQPQVPDLAALHAHGAPRSSPGGPTPRPSTPPWPRLRGVPPLVFAGECDELKAKLAAVARGEAFLLQGGDCAETFDGVTADNVRNKLRVLLQMAVVLTYAASVPVVKLGRLAGQYAKPRSSDLETRDGVTLPAYRGDAVNGFDFTPESRVPDPQRLVEVYHSSASTLNLVRAFVTGGYADLRQVHTWNTDFVRDSPVGAPLREAGRRDRPGADLHAGDRRRPRRVPPRRLPLQPRGADPGVRARADPHRLAAPSLPYDVSSHFVWIGERTRQLDGAHVELLSHIRNPIGVKLGPTTSPDDAIALAAKLNPRERARPADLHHPHGRRQDPRPAAEPRREGHRRRRRGRLGLRPDARQHLRGVARATRPAASTT